MPIMTPEITLYRRTAELLRHCRHAVALTGAGISVESGIPDFRSEGGLWSRFDPIEFGHIESFRRNPSKVWQMLLEMDALLSRSEPNAAHFALAELEKRNRLKSVITQNVDSLHQRAGSNQVIEYHGHGRSLRCDQCGQAYQREGFTWQKLPPRCTCGGPLRPSFVFFGEEIPPDAHRRAVDAARACDLMLVVGTSGTVAPASFLPGIAKELGAFIVEINPERTQLSERLADLCIAERAGKALPAIVVALDEIK
jgi:NAD-dependent deacetylase